MRWQKRNAEECEGKKHTVGLGHESGGALVHGELDKLLREEPEHRQHANPAVLELGLPQPLDVEIARDVEGVEADIANHRPIERGGLVHERHRRRLLRHHAHPGDGGGGGRDGERGRERGAPDGEGGDEGEHF